MADEEGTKLGEELRDGAFAAMEERDGGWFDEAVDLLPVPCHRFFEVPGRSIHG